MIFKLEVRIFNRIEATISQYPVPIFYHREAVINLSSHTKNAGVGNFPVAQHKHDVAIFSRYTSLRILVPVNTN